MKFYNIVIPPRIIQLFFYTFYFPFIVFFVKKKKKSLYTVKVDSWIPYIFNSHYELIFFYLCF